MPKYAIIYDENVLDKAIALTKGCYQVGILRGYQALSGANLRGKAKRYSGRYKASAQSILFRCQSNGLPVREITGPHNKRMVVVGHPEFITDGI